jgi:YebC/PmpR family DNA-binding regulatory protein
VAKHNKWSKIKHRKAVVDKRRGKVWTKISKAIMVAARHGGGDPSSNLSLRYAMDEARYANMPKDTVQRAIDKGIGAGDMSSFESVRYEGYAPGGIAIVVDALTDNRTRTITLVRQAVEDHDGKLGTSGCVAYMFQHVGRIAIVGKGLSDEQVISSALDAGASDVRGPEGDLDSDEEYEWTVLTQIPAFNSVKERMEQVKFPIAEASLAMVPDALVRVAGDAAEQVLAMIDALEDIDDVQKVYTNADIEMAE